MKTLVQTIFVFAVAIGAVELFWVSSSTQQRLQWLAMIPAPGLERLVETEQTRPLIPQLLAIIAHPPQASEVVVNEPTEQTITSAEKALAQSVNNRATPYLMHPGGFCVKPPTQKITDVEPQAIYRWTDAHGRVHFGDKARQKNAQDMSKTYGRRTQGVKLSLEFPGWQGDSLLESALHKEAALMYRILTQYIPRHEWRQINLNLVIFPDQSAFEVYKSQQQANAGWMAYYDGRRNQAYLAVQQNFDLTMRLARHEMTHAMMLGMLGTTPIWISEGMAQYLERLDWQMNSAKVEADHRVYQGLAGSGAGFALLADMDHREFNGPQQQTNYYHASAMMHFLLGHREGQHWLKETLGYFAINPCGPYSAAQFFNQGYPSGLAAVSQRYREWLIQGDYAPHYY